MSAPSEPKEGDRVYGFGDFADGPRTTLRDENGVLWVWWNRWHGATDAAVWAKRAHSMAQDGQWVKVPMALRGAA